MQSMSALGHPILPLELAASLGGEFSIVLRLFVRSLLLCIALREAGTGNGERGTVDSQIVSGFINILTNLRSAIDSKAHSA